MRAMGAILLCLFALPAFAQQSTPAQPTTPATDPLKAICTAFIEQNAQGLSAAGDHLCTCLVRETKSQLTEQEMRAYSQAVTNSQAPPDAVMQKVMGIAATCLGGG